MDKKNSNGYLQKIDEYLEQSPFKGFLHEVDSFFNKHSIFHTFPVNLYETDTEVILEAELPGIDKDLIKIDIQESSIKIIVDSNESKEASKDTHFHRRERSNIQTERIIKIPEPIKKSEAKAIFKNGILKIRAKKLPFEQRILDID